MVRIGVDQLGSSRPRAGGGLAGGCKFLVAFLERALKVEYPLLQVVEFGPGICGIERAKAAALSRLDAEQFG
jgi:hypothetical protein